ncbi:MAG: hypothetical protein NTY36_01365 [Deltaproteobacteria bacterium]|nr:hypothetical protein [Deltaproteobacteria bacterium]
MKKSLNLWSVILLVLLALALGGCCENPDAMKQVQAAMSTLEILYPAVVASATAIAGKEVMPGSQDERVKSTVVATDTALALGGGLRDQYCVKKGVADQLKLQAQQVQVDAKAAGIPIPTANPIPNAPAAAQ